MAAHNNGGIVIAQVERIVAEGSIKPKDVKVPGILVDCVVVAEPPEMHRMNYGVHVRPGLAGEVRVPVENMPKMALDERKIIARRAAFELPPNGVINLGVGAPDGVAAVANEEKVTPYITMTTEAGAVGGVLAGGSSFGSSANAHSVIDQNQMFDFYDGGGLDMTCLGMAECDEDGNVNTSRSAASSTAAAASSTSRRTPAPSSSPAHSPPVVSKSRSRTASCRSSRKAGRASSSRRSSR